jgi:large subunit ribosomal protein L30
MNYVLSLYNGVHRDVHPDEIFVGKQSGRVRGKVAKLYITWIKSGIGYAKDQRRTLKALGLRRLHQSVKHDDSPSIQGMIAKVKHLVEVEEREE